MEEVQFAGAASTSDPHNYKQAMKGDDSERWRDAANAEYNTLLQNRTWGLVDLPPGEKAIGSGWVFKVKHNADGSIERYKARVVAKGYSQRPGVDYHEVHDLSGNTAGYRYYRIVATDNAYPMLADDDAIDMVEAEFKIDDYSAVNRRRRMLLAGGN